jgi:NAD(P)-dependent dehydrogenase (short-subunit alcohol dehydrogenase family)
MRISLDGQRVLVTGGNSGLGAAICAAFAEAGARVAINYLDNPDAAHALADTIGARGAKALALQADVSDVAAVEKMFAQLDSAWDGLDILVNNAGIDGVRAEAWASDPAAWMKVIDVNLKGAYLCARQALMRMKRQGAGVVINITSVHEVIAWSGYSAYTASKAGLSMMAKSMGQEAAPHGVRVLCLAPGAIATPINAHVREDPASHADLIDKIPMGRIGMPEDVARVAVMLASDMAGYITATTVFVDGGMTAYPDFAHGG